MSQIERIVPKHNLSLDILVNTVNTHLDTSEEVISTFLNSSLALLRFGQIGADFSNLDVTKSFGEQLRDYCIRDNTRWFELNISKSTLSRYIHNDTTPRILSLLRMIRVFGLSDIQAKRFIDSAGYDPKIYDVILKQSRIGEHNKKV